MTTNNKRLIKTGVILAIACAALFGSGCLEKPAEKVVIVHIGESPETGEIDQYTVVEFPDGERKRRPYHYGKVGDEFMARKVRGTWR